MERSTPLPIIEVIVKRYRCPHCTRSAARKATIANHLKRCWYEPANKACKTCRFQAERQCNYLVETEQGSGCSCRMHGRECFTTCYAGVDVTNEVKTNCPKWQPDGNED